MSVKGWPPGLISAVDEWMGDEHIRTVEWWDTSVPGCPIVAVNVDTPVVRVERLRSEAGEGAGREGEAE
jgi:hypothetical protein